MPKFIVYACPTGELAEQIQRFFAESLESVGANAVHEFIPHCSLTGFFEDRLSSVPLYTQALTRCYNRALRSRPTPAITIQGFAFRPDWHGLELESPWLKKLIVDFACTVNSPTRKEALRIKDWLHLSLAYEFPTEQGKALSQLASQRIDPTAPVGWELRYYQRDDTHAWTCHQTWPLS